MYLESQKADFTENTEYNSKGKTSSGRLQSKLRETIPEVVRR